MRIVRAFVAMLAALFMGLSLTAALPAAGEDLPERIIDTRLKKKDWRTFVFKGTVEEHVDKKVLIQRKKCRKCRWKIVDKVKTNDKAKFRAKIYAPNRQDAKWKWRAKVNGYGGYAPSYSRPYATYWNG